ncbi:hypothetical protein GCM10027360_14860 [Amycolatopsis echigonensis]
MENGVPGVCEKAGWVFSADEDAAAEFRNDSTAGGSGAGIAGLVLAHPTTGWFDWCCWPGVCHCTGATPGQVPGWAGSGG